MLSYELGEHSPPSTNPTPPTKPNEKPRYLGSNIEFCPGAYVKSSGVYIAQFNQATPQLYSGFGRVLQFRIQLGAGKKHTFPKLLHSAKLI